MIVAAHGLPAFRIFIGTVIGGILAASGASALNCYIDRDLDKVMGRTSTRPLPAGRMAPLNALIFAIGLLAWSAFILTVLVNPLSALLAMIGAVYYAGIYTVLLKRNTVANILIGGGAGAVPVLVGWAAVRNGLSVEALWLFAIVFFWTPPHSWALALVVETDYTRAGVPMMPVARGEQATRVQILLYAIQLLAITLIPVAMHTLGLFYFIVAAVLGVYFIVQAVRLLRVADKAMARTVYKYSSMYLLLLFLAMIVDRLIT